MFYGGSGALRQCGIVAVGHGDNVTWMQWVMEAMWHGGKLCNELETARELRYLGDGVSAGGGCEAAVTART